MRKLRNKPETLQSKCKMQSIIKSVINFGNRLSLAPSITSAKPTSLTLQTILPKSHFSNTTKLSNFQITEQFDYINCKHLQGPVVRKRPCKNPLGRGMNMIKAVVCVYNLITSIAYHMEMKITIMAVIIERYA